MSYMMLCYIYLKYSSIDNQSLYMHVETTLLEHLYACIRNSAEDELSYIPEAATIDVSVLSFLVITWDACLPAYYVTITILLKKFCELTKWGSHWWLSRCVDWLKYFRDKPRPCMNRDTNIANPLPLIYSFEYDILGLILKYFFSITDFKVSL